MEKLSNRMLTMAGTRWVHRAGETLAERDGHWADWARLCARGVARLEDAILEAQWSDDGCLCPWCGEWAPGMRAENGKHAEDCIVTFVLRGA